MLCIPVCNDGSLLFPVLYTAPGNFVSSMLRLMVSPLHNPSSTLSTCFVSYFDTILEVFSDLQHILSPILRSLAWHAGVPLSTVFWQMQFLQPKGSFIALTQDLFLLTLINLLVLQAAKNSLSKLIFFYFCTIWWYIHASERQGLSCQKIWIPSQRHPTCVFISTG